MGSSNTGTSLLELILLWGNRKFSTEIV
uniref:Uncharacterized protein n=1 Tax=Oryza rufipogon TaxID=4529 RepID=A0A0E0R4U7_ORYRU